MATVFDHIVAAVRGAAAFNPDVQVKPHCILWPDKDEHWREALPQLQAALPELLVLGPFAPEERQGPGIWLRCALAGVAEGVSLPNDLTPIIYLPGISRENLRAVENCPDALKPLAELQYRGVFWSHSNGKDWTVNAFLKTDQGGLGLDVAQDNDARRAMQAALLRLLNQDVEALRGRHLDADFFNALLTDGDPARNVLEWLNDAPGFRAQRDAKVWQAFVEVTRSQYQFNPETDGELAGVTHLAGREGAWQTLWERFCEAPTRYPRIPQLMRQCRAPGSDTLFWKTGDGDFGAWPQWNDNQEAQLREALVRVVDLPVHGARKQVAALEQAHGKRRALVWAQLGQAPLAGALAHLAVLADVTTNGLAAGTAQDLQAGYTQRGWQADDALLRALASVARQEDCELVSAVARHLYEPWAEESARHFQNVVYEGTYPGGTIADRPKPAYQDGDCLLFVDGLRYDVGKRLAALLSERGHSVAEQAAWAAVPTVTATAKPAVTPVRDRIIGQHTTDEFDPQVAETGKSLKGGAELPKLLVGDGWIILPPGNPGSGVGKAWTEFSDIDSIGHSHGWKLAQELDKKLAEVVDKVERLVNAGWRRIHIVTDHGWLLLPGGLPKVELKRYLTENQYGRCAAVKDGSAMHERRYPWFWNPTQQFALADGIGCYKAGLEYAHGGLSLQECVTLALTVTSAAGSGQTARITAVDWKGLRCRVTVQGDADGLNIDLRRKPGDPASSVVTPKALKKDGTVSLAVEEDDYEGEDATVVLIGPKGELVAQQPTAIGGDSA